MERSSPKTNDVNTLELEKIYLEKEKLKLANKGFWLDIIGKVGVPISILILSVVTHSSGERAAENRLQFERDMAKSELQRKDGELFLKIKSSNRAENRSRSEFVEKHLDLINSQEPRDKKQLEQYIQIAFERDEQEVILARVESLRALGRSLDSEGESTVNQVDQVSVRHNLNYIELGKEGISKRDFKGATLAFRTHLDVNPHDALVWNYLSYAQMRAGHLVEARESISTAIYYQPTELKTRQLVAINAAKILCSAGDIDEGINYINIAAQAIPGLIEIARRDGELQVRCTAKS